MPDTKAKTDMADKNPVYRQVLSDEYGAGWQRPDGTVFEEPDVEAELRSLHSTIQQQAAEVERLKALLDRPCSCCEVCESDCGSKFWASDCGCGNCDDYADATEWCRKMNDLNTPEDSPMLDTKRYTLVSDDDGHWYLIPSGRIQDLADWLECGDQILPEWVREVDGPHVVTFTEPEIA